MSFSCPSVALLAKQIIHDALKRRVPAMGSIFATRFLPLPCQNVRRLGLSSFWRLGPSHSQRLPSLATVLQCRNPHSGKWSRNITVVFRKPLLYCLLHHLHGSWILRWPNTNSTEISVVGININHFEHDYSDHNVRPTSCSALFISGKHFKLSTDSV